MKNANFERQLDLFEKKIESDLRREIQTLNTTLQKYSVNKIAERVKINEEKIDNFSVTVKKALDNVWKDLNESNVILSKVLSFDCGSCWDILRKNPYINGSDGVYTIKVNSKEKLVYCDMSTDGGGWTAIQRRRDGSTDFYRTWREYKQGFGDPSTNYWIGNDAIHELTKKKDQELRVELQRFNGDKAYAQYSTFYVGNEGTKYKLTVTGYSGTAGDSLDYHNGMKFTTKDQDNDRYIGGNCAVSNHGAWWYNDCRYSNLNGLYGQSGVSGKYTTWYDWKRKYEALKQTQMMIRHKN